VIFSPFVFVFCIKIIEGLILLTNLFKANFFEGMKNHLEPLKGEFDLRFPIKDSFFPYIISKSAYF